MQLARRLPLVGPAAQAHAPDEIIAPAHFFRPIRYVTLKVTNGCNLKCQYCNVEADLPSTPRMSLETYRRVARLLIENARSEHLSLEFHGGEPLLLGDDWYREAIDYAQSLAKRHGKTVRHPLTTNGTMITEERIDSIIDFGFELCVSLDGPPHINDRLRGAGRSCTAGIRRLLARGEQFGVILVLSPANCRDMTEVMEFFRTLGLSRFRVNFLQPQGRAIDALSLGAGGMLEGMTAIFEHMAESRCAVIEVSMANMIERFLEGRPARAPFSCWERQCQAGRTYVAVDHRGSVFSCGTDMVNHRLGHIDRGFDAFEVRTSLCALHHKDSWYDRCNDCSARSICDYSCPTADANDPAYREDECRYTRDLYAYFTAHRAAVERVFQHVRALSPPR